MKLVLIFLKQEHIKVNETSQENQRVETCAFDDGLPLFCYNAESRLGQHVCQKCFMRTPLAISEEKSLSWWNNIAIAMKIGH